MSKISQIFVWIRWLALVAVLILLFCILCNQWVASATRSKMTHTIAELPNNSVGLVLGTSRYGPGGYTNLYFAHRIEAAWQLYKAGKIKHFILSGDNSRVSYNEPIEMQKALIEKGVPPEAITLDYAGFRTLDSVVRCKEVFQQHKFTIISQKFHNHRALFIARYYGLDAVAFNAKAVAYNAKRMYIREMLARCKAVLDLYILHKKPKFLGEKIDIEG